MSLSHEDVREILRIIDESDLAELRIDTEGFSLHVKKRVPAAGASAAEAAPALLRAPAPTPSAGEPSDGMVAIPSPMLGTFYRAESPGAAPFVDVGTQVGPETTVCIIEVMKMMNSVPAGVSGRVAEVCARNGELVEYGEPLFRVTPS